MSLGAPLWVWPAVLIGLASIGLVLWSYRQPVPGSGARALAMTCKLAGIALLLFCLTEPLIHSVRARPGANQLIVLVDTSKSLTIRDRGSTASRSDDVRLELVAAYLVDGPKLRDPQKALAIARAVTSREPKSGRAHAYLAFAMILSDQVEPVDTVIDVARRLGADPACCSGLLVLDSLRRRDVEAEGGRRIERIRKRLIESDG